MKSLSSRIVGLLVVGLIASACAASVDDQTGPTGDVPALAGMCAQDQPDCVDTILPDGVSNGDLPADSDLPLAPPANGENSVGSGLIVGGGLTIHDAIAYQGDQPVAVSGFVVRTAGSDLFCEVLAESFPPQCGGERLSIANADALNAFALVEEGEVQWSENTIVVLGRIADGVLTIDSNVSG
jgi:hypothetical protein